MFDQDQHASNGTHNHTEGNSSSACNDCVGHCMHENNFTSTADPAACSKCFAQECRSVCEEEHGTDGVQHFIDSGCPEGPRDEGEREYQEPPRGASCGGLCHHEVYGETCERGTWGGGQYFIQICIEGVNYAQHYNDSSCAGEIVNSWPENGCHPYGSEKDEHGNQVFESKWCNGTVPMKSLCIADHGDHI